MSPILRRQVPADNCPLSEQYATDPVPTPIVSSPRLLPMQPADKSNLIRSEAELKLEQVRYLPLTDAGVLGVLIRCLTSLAKTKQSG